MRTGAKSGRVQLICEAHVGTARPSRVDGTDIRTGASVRGIAHYYPIYLHLHTADGTSRQDVVVQRIPPIRRLHAAARGTSNTAREEIVVGQGLRIVPSKVDRTGEERGDDRETQRYFPGRRRDCVHRIPRTLGADP